MGQATEHYKAKDYHLSWGLSRHGIGSGGYIVLFAWCSLAYFAPFGINTPLCLQFIQLELKIKS